MTLPWSTWNIIMNKPFLKWAGSKRKIITNVRDSIGVISNKGRLIEPFVGSGTVFMNVKAVSYILSDSNMDLINLFNIIKEDPTNLISYCKEDLFIPSNNNEEVYYQLRKQFNSTTDKFLRAALFLYLNRHGFNGLCRYNKSGEFNVPFGKYKTNYFPESEILFCVERLQRCTFLRQDFRDTMKLARKNDVVYMDPPYAPISKTSSFTGYTDDGFGPQDQIDLAELAKTSNAKVVISNNLTEFTEELYKDADSIIELNVQKSVGSRKDSRGRTKEVMVIYNNSN